MKRKNKLHLEALKIQSFVTSLEETKEQALMAGADTRGGLACTFSLPPICRPSYDQPCLSQGAQFCTHDSC